MSSCKKKGQVFGHVKVCVENLPIYLSNCNFGVYFNDTKKGSDSKAADTSVLPMRMNKGVRGGGYISLWNKKKGKRILMECLVWAYTHTGNK